MKLNPARFTATLFAGALLITGAFAQTSTAFMRLQKPNGTVEILETKARKYTPKSGQGPTVWLVGVAHVGKADYYKSLQKLLDEQDVVLYEGVSKKGVDPAAPKKVEGKVDPRMSSTYQLMSDTLGLQFQLFGIDYTRKTFKNSDMSWEEMQELEKKNPAPKGAMSLTGIGNILNGDSEQGKMLATMLTAIKSDPSSVEAMRLIMVETLANPNAISIAMSPQLSDVLIKSRNGKVLSDLKAEVGKSPTPKSIALFYGAGHMADMEQRLVKDFGYVGGEERWFSAIDGDTKKITSSQGKMMLDMMRAQMSGKKGG